MALVGFWAITSQGPSLVRISVTRLPVEVSWYLKCPVAPLKESERWDEEQEIMHHVKFPLALWGTYDGGEEEMVRKELQAVDFCVILEFVQFQTLAVINIHVFPLGHRKEGLVVQPLNITHSFSKMKLTAQLASLPIKGTDVALLSSNQNVSGNKSERSGLRCPLLFPPQKEKRTWK